MITSLSRLLCFLKKPPFLREANIFEKKNFQSLFFFQVQAFSQLSLPTFNNYGLKEEILKSLNDQEIHTPSPIQQLAIPSLLGHTHDHHYLAAQTGTGKTLAYLLPILHLIKSLENNQRNTLPNRPFAIILVPSKELVDQILRVCKSFLHYIKLNAGAIGLDRSYLQEKRMLNQGVDILVTTIDRLENHRRRQNVFLSKTLFLVVDEADTLIDCGFKEIIEEYLQICIKLKIRTIFVSATFTAPLSRLFDQAFGKNSLSLKTLIEKKTHMNLSNLHHEFIHIKDLDKQGPLLKLLKEYKEKIKKTKGATLIFCNSIPSCRSLEYKLKQEGFDCVSLHGDIPKNVRMQNFQRFCKQEVNILIATDLGSRGLDFPFLNHVINFDFPKTTSDYLHRAGRAGRAGRPGFVTSLYHNKDNSVITELRSSNESGRPLEIKASAFSLKNKEDLKKTKKAESTGDKFIEKDKASLVPKSYIDFKNKWLSDQTAKDTKPTQIRGWKKEKNYDRREVRELKRKQHEHKKLYGNKFGKKLKNLKANIRRINRKRSPLKEKKNKKT